MDSALKQRLIGAAVLVALAMIFLPMLLQDREAAGTDAARVPLDVPAAPDDAFETREVPLTLPTPAAPGESVLGLDAAPPADDPNAVATVDQAGEAAPRTGGPVPASAADAVIEPDAPPTAVDAATGQPLAPAAAAPAAVAPAPLPASTGGGRWAVNVGSFSNLDNARALAERLRAQALPVASEAVDVNGKPAMRLRVGPYAERTAAEAARLRVERVTGGAAAVVALDAASPAAAAPASRPGAAPQVGFAVQLGALSSEADATALRDRARAAGFVAFHQRIATDRGVVWRVRVGPEADRAAADRLRERVATRLGLRDAIVVPHP